MLQENRRHLFALLGVFAVVFLANIGALGLRSEDWYMLPPFGDWLGQGWRGVLRFTEMERIQFTTFWIQGLLIRAFGLRALPLLLFLFAAHAASCLLLYRILVKLTGDAGLAVTAALCCLLVPTSLSEAVYVTHTFFVFPVTLLLASIHLYLFPVRNRWLDLACLTAVPLAGQFAGEQAVPLFYLVFLLAGLHARAARRDRPRQILRAAVPFCVCAATMAWIFLRRTFGFLRKVSSEPADHTPAWKIVREFLRLHVLSLDPFNWLFGRFSQRVSPGTWIEAVLLAAILFFLYRRMDRRRERPPGLVSRRSLALGAVAAGLAYVTPILLSTITGYRSVMAPKYIYASGFCFALLLVLAVDEAARRLSRDRRWLFAGLAGYLGALTLYGIRDIWGTQKRVDDRLWGAIDAGFAPRVKYLILDGSLRHGIVPDWQSCAYSDFLDDGAAVPARLEQVAGRAPIVVRRDAFQAAGDKISLRDRAGRRYEARPEEILAVVFRFGPRFGDLESGTLRSFPVFEDYLRFRRNERDANFLRAYPRT